MFLYRWRMLNHFRDLWYLKRFYDFYFIVPFVWLHETPFVFDVLIKEYYSSPGDRPKNMINFNVVDFCEC